MASEYIKWQCRDVEPNTPPPPMTKKEYIANWFYYNKLWIVISAVLLWVLGSIFWNLLGIGQVKPDYIFAYIGDRSLSEEAAAAFTEGIEAFAEDVNGDGVVTVELRQYVMNPGGDEETALYYSYASDVTLMADISEAESYFFLTADPLAVQTAYEILANADGSAPANGDYEIEGKVFSWNSCPLLRSLNIEECSNLYIGRRYFTDEKQTLKHEADASLWQLLTEDACN